MITAEYNYCVGPFGDLASITIDGNDIVLSYPDYEKDLEEPRLKEVFRVNVGDAELIAKGFLTLAAAVRVYNDHHDDD